MPYPEPPKQKPVAAQKGPRGSLALRIDRAAGDLNPLLIVLALGLLILNVTLYLGIAAARGPAIWAAAHQIGGPAAAATPASEAAPGPSSGR